MTTDTPEIDAAVFQEHGRPGSAVVQADFARRIQRELNGKLKLIDSLNAIINELNERINGFNKDQLELKASLKTSLDHGVALQLIIETLCRFRQLERMRHHALVALAYRARHDAVAAEVNGRHRAAFT